MPKTTEDDIQFDLDVRTYNLLASTDRAGLGILAVIVVHEAPSSWVDMCDETTTLTHCAYYLPLTGMPETSNTATVAPNHPRTDTLTPDAMRALMDVARARWSA